MFEPPGADEAVQGPSNLFKIRLHNDDVQDFDTRLDQALLSACEIPTEMVLEGLYKSKLQDSVQLQTVLAMYEQEKIRNNGQPSYSRLKRAVRRHIDQVNEDKKFHNRERNSGKRDSSQESKTEKSQRVEEWENAISAKQLDSVRKEAHVVSVMIQRLEADAI